MALNESVCVYFHARLRYMLEGEKGKRYDKEKSLETVVVSRLFWWTIQDLNLDLISIALFYMSKNGGIGIKTCIKFAG